jgi:hypothetical protein
MKNLKLIISILILNYSFLTINAQSCVNTTLSITLDNYPTETTWTLKNNQGIIIYQGGNYLSTQKNQNITTTICIVQGQSYIFEIKDSYGDGICCNYGNGSYSIKYGTSTLCSGGSFTSSMTHNFCFNCTPNSVGTPTCQDGVQNGNELGVDCGGPNCRPCGSQTSGPNTTLQIQLDRYPSETSWQLLSGATVIESGSNYSNQDQLIIRSLTLLEGQNYSFRILDTYGDGLCCRLNGSGAGYYKITSSNGTILVSGSIFTSSATHNFCINCSTNYYTCTDGIKNGYETGIDCGGPDCIPCGVTNRKIVFVHGFAGAESTWVRMNEVHNKNFVGTLPNWERRWTDARAIAYGESSLDEASNGAKVQVNDKMVEMAGGNAPGNDGIIIAHSMGGLAIRDMDRKYDQSYGPKPYGGIITFGTPHGGAPISNSIVSNAVTNYGTKMCNFVGSQINKISIDFPILASITNLGNLLFQGSLFSNSITNKCINLVDQGLGNLLFQRGIMIDAQVGSQKVNNLYTAPNVRKIALVGVETSPVTLRYWSSFAKGNSASYFQDNQDHEKIDYLNQIIFRLSEAQNLSIATLKFSTYNAISNVKEQINNINRDMMGLTGAIQLQYNFSGQCRVDAYHYGNLQSNEIKYASTPEGCDQYNYDPTFGGVYQVISTPLYNSFNLVTQPHDGLIPVYSAQAFPGATVLTMDGSNHSQMKNDDNTRQLLRRTWNANDGVIDQWWRTTIKN